MKETELSIKTKLDHYSFKKGWNAAIETACNELQQFVHKDHTVADIEKTLLKLKITK